MSTGVVVRRYCDIGIPGKGNTGSSEGVMSVCCMLYVVFPGNNGDLSGGGIYRPFSYSTGSQPSTLGFNQTPVWISVES
jgi:hypothetical protein